MDKIGIFGGSFNPPHNGHIRLVKQIAAIYSFNEILIVPTYLPPHKDAKSGVSPQQRLDMCRLAFDFPGTKVCDIEIRRGGKSYTYDTLVNLKAESDAALSLIIGSDMLLTFDLWYRWRDILSMAHIVAASRTEGCLELKQLKKKANELNNMFPGSVTVCEVKPFEISSTEIREAVQKGKEIGEYVPDSIKQYIYDGGLYHD